MSDVIQIVASCGLSDALALLARVPSVLDFTGASRVHFWLVGGWSSMQSEAERVLNLSSLATASRRPCERPAAVFDWRIPKVACKFPIRFPFYVAEAESYFGRLVDELKEVGRPVVGVEPADRGLLGFFNPLSTLPGKKWNELLISLRSQFSLVRFGDCTDVVDDDLFDLVIESDLVDELSAIQNCDAFIGAGSWRWQVAAYAGRVTVVYSLVGVDSLSAKLPDPVPSHVLIEKVPEPDRCFERLLEVRAQCEAVLV